MAPFTAAVAADAELTEQELYELYSWNSQAGMRNCLADKAEESVKILGAAEKEAAEALGKWDEDRKYVDQAKARLVASNKAFRSIVRRSANIPLR
ncbi:hypothetical protein [Achromobacter sp.]|uniref:hypothetical protein n=1 Tax=Achromobacter sp. TaxID=134375 RepID=UPI0028A6B32A|nr:hypothetical protein [Achromobacter sp.]